MAELQQPLRGDDDCDALGIGEKSAKKLREIVSTGRLRRNQARAPPLHPVPLAAFSACPGAMRVRGQPCSWRLW